MKKMKTTDVGNARGNRTKYKEVRANGKRKHETQTIVK